MSKLSEKDLAKEVVSWLKKNNYEVYQEVQVFAYGQIADIVAVKDNRIWVIETKTSFGLKVLEQAHSWKNFANKVSVAVPVRKRRYGRAKDFGRLVCSVLNIGLIEVGINFFNKKHGQDYSWIEEMFKPYEEEIDMPHLQDSLCELHKTFAEAGNNSGDRLTPIGATMKLKYLRSSIVYYKHQMISIEIWQDQETQKLYIMNSNTKEKISLDNAIGDEV